MQSWPPLEVMPCTAPGTARQSGASGSTSRAFLPPSSMAQLISRSPHCAATLRPVAVEPVNMTKSVPSMSGVPSSAPRPVTTWRRPAGSPASSSKPGRPERTQRCERVGLEHHAVAGHERRQGVADAEREGVVPGRDDADHAARPVMHARGRQHGQRALRPLRPQEAGRRVPVVPRLDGDVEHLLEGVDPRLAALELQDVEDLLRVGEHQVVVAQQDRGALLHRATRPRLLRLAGRRARRRDVVGAAPRHLRQRRSA